MLTYLDAPTGTLIVTRGIKCIMLASDAATALGGARRPTWPAAYAGPFEMDQFAIVIGTHKGDASIAQVITNDGTIGWVELKHVMAV